MIASYVEHLPEVLRRRRPIWQRRKRLGGEETVPEHNKGVVVVDVDSPKEFYAIRACLAWLDLIYV